MDIPALTESQTEVLEMRKADVTNMEAMQNAKQPSIILILTPIIGAMSVISGSKLRKEVTT